MADFRPERRFTRIDRLPPYVFNITAELKMAARRRGEDIIDFSMGNPDGATPPTLLKNFAPSRSVGYARLFHVSRHTAFTPRDFSLVSGTL